MGQAWKCARHDYSCTVGWNSVMGYHQTPRVTGSEESSLLEGGREIKFDE